MNAPAPITQSNIAPIHCDVHLICAAFAHEDVEVVVATIKALARDHGYRGPLHLYYRCPKPRTINANALILTDHPSRIARTQPELLAAIIGFLRHEVEVLIPGYLHLRPRTEAATAVLVFDGMRKAMRSARIREGLHLARQRGVHVGRKRISHEPSELMSVVEVNGSYRAAAKALASQGIEISKSALHSKLRGQR